MAEALVNDPRKKLYSALVSSPDKDLSGQVKKFSYNKFNSLLDNSDFVQDLFMDISERGVILDAKNPKSSQDPNEFISAFVQKELPPAPKPQAAPVQQFPVGIAAPASIKGAAPSITDIAREMAFKPPVQPQMPEEEMSLLDKTGQTATELISGFNRALLKTPSSIVKTASELGVGVLNMLGGNMQSEDAILYNLADKYDKWLDTSETARKFVGSPEYTGLATDVGSGLGQVVSMIAAGPQGASKALLSTPGVLKAVSQKMFSKPSLIAFSQVFNSEFENMKAKGESEQTAFNQGLVNAMATSPLENLPLINLAERLNKTIGVKLARRVLNAIQQGVEEGGQEAIQQIFSNLTNNQLVESEENIVDWAKGIQPSAEAGGVVGLLIGGLANAKAARKYSKKPAAAPGVEAIPAEEVQGTGRRVVVDSIEEVPAEFRDKVIEVSGPLGRFGIGKKQYAYVAPTETIDITPQAPTEVTPEPAVTETAPVAEEIPFEEVTPVTEEATVAPLTEEELAQIEETELTPEEEAALLAQEETAPVAPVQVLRPELPEIQVPKPEGFAPSLRKLGYTDEEISKMTLEQQQDIVINKTEPARAAGESKVDVAKENQRVEKVAEAQRKIDEEIAAEEAALAAPVAQKEVQVGGIVRGYENILGSGTIGDIRSELPDDNSGTLVLTGADGNQYAVSYSRRGGDGENIFEQGASTPRGGHIYTAVQIQDTNNSQEVEQAKRQAETSLASILPTVKKGKINKGAVEGALQTSQAAPEVVSAAPVEEVAPEAPAVPAPKGRKKKEAPVTPASAAPETKEGKKAEAKEETRIEQSKSRAKDSKDAQNHSADLSGEAYELEDGTGLIQGFNLMGKPVYSGYKKGKRTRVDIDSYTGDVFTAEELSALKELKKELEASEKASQTQDPFKQQGRVAKTDSVPENVRKFVEDITKSLGIDKKIIIITDSDFNEGQYQKHGLYGTLAQVRSAKQSASNPYEYGSKRYMSDADAFYIYYDGKLKSDQLFTVVSHEIGHIVEQEVFNNSSEQTKKSVKEDYEKWLASLTGKTVEEVAKETRDITLADLIEGNTRKFDSSKDRYISSFSEYFADNVAKWARTSAKPKSAVDKYFSGIVEAFKKLYDYVSEKGLYSKSLFEWLDGMYEAETTTTPSFTSQQSSEAATAFDKAKTSKGFDKKYGKGAYKALSDITKNFDAIMDKVSDKIKQDCL